MNHVVWEIAGNDLVPFLQRKVGTHSAGMQIFSPLHKHPIHVGCDAGRIIEQMLHCLHRMDLERTDRDNLCSVQGNRAALGAPMWKTAAVT